MSTEAEKAKILADYKEGTEVYCEVDKVNDPKENPFKKVRIYIWI